MLNFSSFFQFLRVGLNVESPGAIQENSIFEIDAEFAAKQGVAAFLFDGIQKSISSKSIAPDSICRRLKMTLYAHTLQLEKQCKAQYARAVELSSLYADEGIRVVVLKGIAAGLNYPMPQHRPCGDFDCYLMGDYVKGNEIARNAGAEVEYHSYKHSHITYKGLMVENHQFLTAHRGNKQMKRFEKCLIDLLNEGYNCKIGNTCMECPSPLFNAVYLTHHAKEHFISEGIALRHLCDWAMLLHKHADRIDWQQFTIIANEFGLRKFADAMTCLSVKYLKISIPKGYCIAIDDESLGVLESALFDGLVKGPQSSSSFLNRINKTLRFKQNDKRLRLFSDTSYTIYVLRQMRGLLFDRNPKI